MKTTIETGTQGDKPKDLKLQVIVIKEMNGTEKPISNLDRHLNVKRLNYQGRWTRI